MIIALQYIMYFLAVSTAGMSVFYIIKSKRRTLDKTERGLYDARKNMAMGAMLLCFGSIQLFLHTFDSWFRVGVGFVFLLVGFFNLFAGIRSHAYYSRG